MRKFQKGFTLIEILIVLAVLAVLAAVVVPNVAGFLGRGKERGFDSDRRILQAAVDAWRTDVGARAGNKWPTITDSNGAVTSVNCTEDGVETNGVDVGVIDTNCHLLEISSLAPTYIKGTDVVRSFAYSTGTDTDATNSPAGSYIWYVDASGLVQGKRWTDSDSDNVIDASEIAASDGMVADVYP